MKKMKLRIHTWPEKILKKRTKKVENIDESLRETLSEMLTLMRVSGGAGLAGNQAGLDLQLVVIESEDQIFKLINPVIIKQEGKITFAEGCLSFPDLELEVKRKKRIVISALDEFARKVTIEAEGLLAVIFQHEIDHLNGITFIDRVSIFQRIKAYPKLKSIARRTKNGMCE